MKEIIEAQRLFYATGATKDIRFRLEQLKKLKNAIRTWEDKIEEALWKDLHKSAYETYLTEISIVLQEIKTHIRNLGRWAKPHAVSTPWYMAGGKSRILYEPLGIALIISPWNYPFQLTLTPLVGALSAGNCVILKPAPDASHTSRLIAEMIASIFPPEYVRVIEGGKEISQSLLAERFDTIFFTGSPSTGRIVMKAAAEHLTPVTLELGGKSPCIVGQQADLRLAAKRIVWGKFLNAGQTCIAPDYLLVHAAVREELIEHMKHYTRKFYGSDASQCPDYPRIIRQSEIKRLSKLMEKGKISIGGEIHENQLYIAPTILTDILPDDPIMQQEIFGPLLPVIEFHQLEEAIRLIHTHEKPLALYYFGSPEIARQVIAETHSGGVCVNDTIMHLANLRLPFGGVGNSGIGKYHGKESFTLFSNKRAVMYEATWWDNPLKYPPYKHLSILKRFL